MCPSVLGYNNWIIANWTGVLNALSFVPFVILKQWLVKHNL